MKTLLADKKKRVRAKAGEIQDISAGKKKIQKSMQHNLPHGRAQQKKQMMPQRTR